MCRVCEAKDRVLEVFNRNSETAKEICLVLDKHKVSKPDGETLMCFLVGGSLAKRNATSDEDLKTVSASISIGYAMGKQPSLQDILSMLFSGKLMPEGGDEYHLDNQPKPADVYEV